MANPDTAISIQKNLRILVAEDNTVNQKLIQRILQTAGYAVDMVDNGRDAVELSSRTQYNLILMDIQMPLMDGYEATKAIRKAEGGLRRAQLSRMRNKTEKDTDAGDQRPVPIIALTGNNIEAEMEKCRDLGMNDFLGKPLFRDQLLSLIKKWTITEPECLASGKAQNHVSNPNAKESSVHQPIDLNRALSEFLGEKEILGDLLKEFIEKVYSQIESIRQATLNQDYKVIAREAHSIKGGAANLTADKVAGSASDLEKAAKLAQVEPVRHLVGMLEENLKQLENYLQNIILSVPGIGK